MSKNRLAVEIRRAERNDGTDDDSAVGDAGDAESSPDELRLRSKGLVTLPPAIVTRQILLRFLPLVFSQTRKGAIDSSRDEWMRQTQFLLSVICLEFYRYFLYF